MSLWDVDGRVDRIRQPGGCSLFALLRPQVLKSNDVEQWRVSNEKRPTQKVCVGRVRESQSGSKYRSAEFRATAFELFFQASHNAGVHLADAGFGQSERVADVLHCQFFVIVQDDDQAFVAI